jgi:hypothetical protein
MGARMAVKLCAILQERESGGIRKASEVFDSFDCCKETFNVPRSPQIDISDDNRVTIEAKCCNLLRIKTF